MTLGTVAGPAGGTAVTAEYVVPVGHQLNARLSSVHQSPGVGFTTPPGSLSLPRPNPSLSNKGLVIVQVQNERPGGPPGGATVRNGGGMSCRLMPVYDSVLKRSVCCQEDGHEEDETTGREQQQELVLFSAGRSGPAAAVSSYPRGEDILSSATHQLIHGFPPFLHQHEEEEEDEEEEEEEEEEDIDDEFHGPEYSPPPAEDPDEGYRTNSSSSFGGSPASSVHSPASRDDTATATAVPTVAVSSRSGGGGGRDEEEGSNNLMWLVDFKLDFFNDIDKNGERQGLCMAFLYFYTFTAQYALFSGQKNYNKETVSCDK
jgi:hypothetical protein